MEGREEKRSEKCITYVDVSVNDFPGVCFGDDDAVYSGCRVGHGELFNLQF